MCRYAMKPYDPSMVCVPCRYVSQGTERCPFCREPLWLAGYDFQAPRKGNDSGWAAVQIVKDSGMNYDSCGCDGPGYRPRTKAQARQDATQRPRSAPNRKPRSVL